MDTNIIDQATATAGLGKARDGLAKSLAKADETMEALRQAIVDVRPSGLLTVDEMAEAIGRDRNYVDSVWSSAKQTNKGKQTRVLVTGDAGEARAAVDRLKTVAGAQRNAAEAAKTARAERDRVVALVYSSKLLGPTAIASAVKVDRNHVLRIARRAGVAPAHRQGSRNQYSDNLA